MELTNPFWHTSKVSEQSPHLKDLKSLISFDAIQIASLSVLLLN